MDDNEGRGERLPAEITHESVEGCLPSQDPKTLAATCGLHMKLQINSEGLQACMGGVGVGGGQRGLSVKRVTTSGGAPLAHISPATHWKHRCHRPLQPLCLSHTQASSWGGGGGGGFRPVPVDTDPSTTSAVQHPPRPLRTETSPGGRGHPKWCRRSRQELRGRTCMSRVAVRRGDQYEP